MKAKVSPALYLARYKKNTFNNIYTKLEIYSFLINWKNYSKATFIFLIPLSSKSADGKGANSYIVGSTTSTTLRILIVIPMKAKEPIEPVLSL